MYLAAGNVKWNNLAKKKKKENCTRVLAYCAIREHAFENIEQKH